MKLLTVGIILFGIGASLAMIALPPSATWHPIFYTRYRNAGITT